MKKILRQLDRLFPFYMLVFGFYIIILLLKTAMKFSWITITQDSVIAKLLDIDFKTYITIFLICYMIYTALTICIINFFIHSEYKFEKITRIVIKLSIIPLITCSLIVLTAEQFELILATLNFFALFSFLFQKAPHNNTEERISNKNKP